MSPDRYQARRLILAYLNAAPRDVQALAAFFVRVMEFHHFMPALQDLKTDGLITDNSRLVTLTDAGLVAASQL